MVKKYLPAIFLSITFVLLLLFLSNRSSLNFVEEQKVVPTTVPTPTEAPWQTYTNADFGVTFLYPNTYFFEKIPNDSSSGIYFWKNGSNTSLYYTYGEGTNQDDKPSEFPLFDIQMYGNKIDDFLKAPKGQSGPIDMRFVKEINNINPLLKVYLFGQDIISQVCAGENSAHKTIVISCSDAQLSNPMFTKFLSTLKFLPDTSTWKTYKNTEHNFELKYPKDWYSAEDKSIGFFISNKPIGKVSGIYYPTTDQIIIKYYFFLSAFENGYGITEYSNDQGDTIVSDTKYMSPDPNDSFGAQIDYQKQNQDINKLLPITNQILSTFKFTNSVLLNPTPTETPWQTYRNEKYGFEFQVPTEYIIESRLEDGNQIEVFDITPYRNYSGYRLYVTKNKYTTINEYYSKQKNKTSYNPINKSTGKLIDRITVSNFPGVNNVYIDKDFHWSETTTVGFWLSDGYVYELFYGDGGNFEIFSKILNTFKFTK